MIFTEFRFLALLGVVFALYWALKSLRYQKIVLLLASYAFYAAWDFRFLWLLALSTWIDFWAGNAIAKAESSRRRRLCLWMSLIVNLGVLGYFKYCQFFIDSFVDLAGFFGATLSRPTLDIVLPIGISFYTFQSMSYTLDIYRGRYEPTASLLDFATFIAFFPQLVAGPIVRANTFLPQLQTRRVWEPQVAREALLVFLIGFLKKAAISDNIARYVDAYYAAPEDYLWHASYLATALYAVQIYCDFSGYSDMAIGAAGLLGYTFPVNFDFPYLALSLTTYWRRWHITLSTWFFDYVYEPLSMSIRDLRVYGVCIALFVTFTLSGLWHGAALTFLAWGAAHGLALVLETLTRKQRKQLRRGVHSGVYAIAGWAWTFWFVCLSYILFRSPTFSAAVSVLKAYVLFASPGTRALPGFLASFLVLLGVVHLALYKRPVRAKILSLPGPAFSALCAVFAVVIHVLRNTENQAFIYFQF